MRNRYRRPVASSTATSSSPRNRSSSGAARNVPSRTFLPNNRPLLTQAPFGRRKLQRAAYGGADSWFRRSKLAALDASPASEPFHEVVAVGEGPLADLGGDAGPFEQVLDLEPGVEAQPGWAGGQAVGHRERVRVAGEAGVVARSEEHTS